MSRLIVQALVASTLIALASAPSAVARNGKSAAEQSFASTSPLIAPMGTPRSDFSSGLAPSNNFPRTKRSAQLPLEICCVMAAAAQSPVANFVTDISLPPRTEPQPVATKEKTVETVQGVVILRGSVTPSQSGR